MKRPIYTASWIVLSVVIAFSVNRRACELGASECWESLSSRPKSDAPAYVASHPLLSNDLLEADDIVFPSHTSVFARVLYPDKKSLVGRYVKVPVGQAQRILPGNLSDEPTLVAAEGKCLVTASLGAYQSLRSKVRPGSHVQLRCAGSRFSTCSEVGGSVIARTIDAHVLALGDTSDCDPNRSFTISFIDQ